VAIEDGDFHGFDVLSRWWGKGIWRNWEMGVLGRGLILNLTSQY
jgi:hypothetical protein